MAGLKRFINTLQNNINKILKSKLMENAVDSLEPVNKLESSIEEQNFEETPEIVQVSPVKEQNFEETPEIVQVSPVDINTDTKDLDILFNKDKSFFHNLWSFLKNSVIY